MISEIIKELKKRGFKAEETTNFKNGVEKLGIAVGDGSIRPNIYVDEYISEGLTPKEIAEKVIEVYTGVEVPMFDPETMTEWEYAKDKVILGIQRKTQEELVKKQFLDLELYVRVKIDSDNNASYKVNHAVLEKFGISEDELFEAATANTKRRVQIRELSSIFPMCLLPISGPRMLVCSNQETVLGAAVMAIPDVLSGVAEEHESNLIIIPSSIHECIIVFEDDFKDREEYLNGMIQEINENCLKPEEVLSDHLYLFNSETGMLEC